jgi:polyphosphate glucokinase
VHVLGIDIGGTGVKGAPVDTAAGEPTEDRFRLETPRPATPDAVAQCVGDVAAHFGWTGPVGVTFPGVITHGTVRTAANMEPDWIGVDAETLFAKALRSADGTAPRVLNDADAAGVAEIAHGAGRGRDGVALMLTFGTGIGSALFLDGRLVPNTELGHLELRGKGAEDRAAARVRDEKELSWDKWAKRVQEYLSVVEALLSPDLIIVGGGVSKHADKFLPLLQVRGEIVAAQLANNAGIVGAAMAAAPSREAHA